MPYERNVVAQASEKAFTVVKGQASEQPSLWLVAEAYAGQRVDNYLLRELKGVPRHLVYRLLRQGKVRLNGKRTRPATKVAAGDELRVPALRKPSREKVVPTEGKLPPVVHEDGDFIVFAKPAGLAVHGGSGLNYGLIELARHLMGMPELELAHRLDKETSGLIVLAKRRAALRWFHEQLRMGNVSKIYRAAVSGQWSKEAGRIDVPLQKVPADQGGRRSIVGAAGLPALTKTRCDFQAARGAILEIDLKTGKTHQARAHLAHVGLPIIGDDRYGDRKVNRAAAVAGHHGLFLHAWRLRFAQRGENGELSLECELPEKFASVRKWLADDEEKERING